MSETQSSKEVRWSRGAGFEAGVVSFSLVLDMTDRMESFCEKLDFLIEAGLARDSDPAMALCLIEEAVERARKNSKELIGLAGKEKDEAGGNGVRVVSDEAARLREAKDHEAKAVYLEAEQRMKDLWAAGK